ncbi:hypothetical protein A8709_01965 [Paenibacillus pectinilyticus]|uniref:Uncharacterized protein n=1 Tax=Paenibacillus pectinilyticus TaxID=512399 RepID=A0A1C1A6M9_9BACL|nr:DUF5412 family protein [Paenibacillus pectinilyticus]OCT16229.1 hypothetical protein A8709_01965 [Paenibacillus pectinilyticus]
MDQPTDWSREESDKRERIRVGVKAIAIAVIVVGLILSIGIYMLFSQAINMLSGMCSNDILSEHSQPDGDYKLVVFERNCGATTAYSYHLSLIKANSDLKNQGGNKFVSKENFVAFWENDKSIFIHARANDGFERETSYKGIQIRYAN